MSEATFCKLFRREFCNKWRSNEKNFKIAFVINGTIYFVCIVLGIFNVVTIIRRSRNLPIGDIPDSFISNTLPLLLGIMMPLNIGFTLYLLWPIYIRARRLLNRVGTLPPDNSEATTSGYAIGYTSIVREAEEVEMSARRAEGTSNDEDMPTIKRTEDAKSMDMSPGKSTEDAKSADMSPGKSTEDAKSADMPPVKSTEDAKSVDMPPGKSTEYAKSEYIPPGKSTKDAKYEYIPPGKSTKDAKSEDMPPGKSTEDVKFDNIPPKMSTEKAKCDDILPGRSTKDAKFENLSAVRDTEAMPFIATNENLLTGISNEGRDSQCPGNSSQSEVSGSNPYFELSDSPTQDGASSISGNSTISEQSQLESENKNSSESAQLSSDIETNLVSSSIRTENETLLSIMDRFPVDEVSNESENSEEHEGEKSHELLIPDPDAAIALYEHHLIKDPSKIPLPEPGELIIACPSPSRNIGENIPARSRENLNIRERRIVGAMFEASRDPEDETKEEETSIKKCDCDDKECDCDQKKSNQ